MESKSNIPAIESLIFAAPQAIQKEEIKYCLENSQGLSISMEDILADLETIKTRYQAPEFGIELKEVGGGYQFLSKPDYFSLIADYIKINARKKLSRAAMESLAIIAYKQPISKSEVEQIRGVNSDHSIQKLLDKELIEIKGRSEGPGKPILLGTSDRFMEYFGLRNLSDLPKLKDFASPDQEIGEAPPIEETIEIRQVLESQTGEDE
jgi:segregation and condensation protein B